MAEGQRQRIYPVLKGKINDEDRTTISALLVKAGYTVRVGSEKPGGKGQSIYFIEYWEENDEQKQN